MQSPMATSARAAEGGNHSAGRGVTRWRSQRQRHVGPAGLGPVARALRQLVGGRPIRSPDERLHLFVVGLDELGRAREASGSHEPLAGREHRPAREAKRPDVAIEPALVPQPIHAARFRQEIVERLAVGGSARRPGSPPWPPPSRRRPAGLSADPPRNAWPGAAPRASPGRTARPRPRHSRAGSRRRRRTRRPRRRPPPAARAGTRARPAAPPARTRDRGPSRLP